MKRHSPRAWEFSRFWQNEQQPGRSRYVAPIYDFTLLQNLPERLRMPVTRGEHNRFRLSLKKSIVQAKHRRGLMSGKYLEARMRRLARRRISTANQNTEKD